MPNELLAVSEYENVRLRRCLRDQAQAPKKAKCGNNAGFHFHFSSVICVAKSEKGRLSVDEKTLRPVTGVRASAEIAIGRCALRFIELERMRFKRRAFHELFAVFRLGESQYGGGVPRIAKSNKTQIESVQTPYGA